MGKAPVVEVISEIREDKEANTTTALSEGEWTPGFFRRFPWVGLASLFTIVLCTLGAVVVLVTSNGTPKSKWPKILPPNVLLSILTGVANICFTVAIGNGIAIAWWRRTLKGATIKELHRDWSFSASMLEIALSLKYFNWIALASLAAKLTIIDSALMQKATTQFTGMDDPIYVDNISGFVNQTFPDTGTTRFHGLAPSSMTAALNDDLKEWQSGYGTFANYFENCDGYCLVEVPGIGFQFDCTEPMVQHLDYQLTQQQQIEADGILPEGPPLFNITFTPGVYQNDTDPNTLHPYIFMNMSYARMHAASNGDMTTCPTDFFTQSCNLLPAVISYPILITDIDGIQPEHTVYVGANDDTFNNRTTDFGTFDRNLQQLNGFPVVKRLYPVADISNGHKQSITAGLVQAFEMYLAGDSRLVYEGSGSMSISQNGFAPQYLTGTSQGASFCSYDYGSPLVAVDTQGSTFPDIVTQINQMTFSLAYDVSLSESDQDVDHETNYNAKVYGESIHYKTDYYYMAGAIASTLLCTLLVLPTFWGFWELGRKVTLGPVEIAHAFRSPMMANVHTGAISQVVKEVGDTKIQYGPIISGEATGEFAMADPAQVAASHYELQRNPFADTFREKLDEPTTAHFMPRR